MHKILTDFNEFDKEIKQLGLKLNVEDLTFLDYNFLQIHENFTIINIRDYTQDPNNIIILTNDWTIAYSKNHAILDKLKQFNSIIKKKYGESTAITFLLLDSVLSNYKLEFEDIRKRLVQLEQTLEIDKIEEEARVLRKLIDRLEDFGDILIKLGERKLEEFNNKLIDYDYSILAAESKYWLERCRSNMYRIASLRTKCDIKSNSDLNARITKLTVIMTFLTIVSIVIAIPATIGAIFGIPALSNAYFEGHNALLITTIIIFTLVSVVLGFIYWKSLKLRV